MSPAMTSRHLAKPADEGQLGLGSWGLVGLKEASANCPNLHMSPDDSLLKEVADTSTDQEEHSNV